MMGVRSKFGKDPPPMCMASARAPSLAPSRQSVSVPPSRPRQSHARTHPTPTDRFRRPVVEVDVNVNISSISHPDLHIFAGLHIAGTRESFT